MTHQFDVIIERVKKAISSLQFPRYLDAIPRPNRSMSSWSASVKPSSFVWKLKARCLSRWISLEFNGSQLPHEQASQPHW